MLNLKKSNFCCFFLLHLDIFNLLHVFCQVFLLAGCLQCDGQCGGHCSPLLTLLWLFVCPSPAAPPPPFTWFFTWFLVSPVSYTVLIIVTISCLNSYSYSLPSLYGLVFSVDGSISLVLLQITAWNERSHNCANRKWLFKTLYKFNVFSYLSFVEIASQGEP